MVGGSLRGLSRCDSIAWVLAMLLWVPQLQVVADTGTTTLGLRYQGGVVLAADAAFRRGATVMAHNSDRISSVGPLTLLAACGDVPSGDQFAAYLARNFALDTMVHGRSPHTKSAAHFTRRELARLLRRSPVQADFLLAGVDTEQGSKEGVVHARVGVNSEADLSDLDGDSSATGSTSETNSEHRQEPTAHPKGGNEPKVIPRLYWLDRAGGCAELPYASHGPAAPMVDAAMDEQWRPDLSEDDALELVRKCVAQLGRRHALAAVGWQVMVVDERGCRLAAMLDSAGRDAHFDDTSGFSSHSSLGSREESL